MKGIREFAPLVFVSLLLILLAGCSRMPSNGVGDVGHTDAATPNLAQNTPLVWGPATHGLVAAAVLYPAKPTYAYGEKVDVRYRIRNIGKSRVQFISCAPRLNQTSLETADGRQVPCERAGLLTLPLEKRFTINPGQEVEINNLYDFAFARAGGQGKKLSHAPTVFICPPGEYVLHYLIDIPGKRAFIPDAREEALPEDWSGFLETGLTTVTLRDADASPPFNEAYRLWQNEKESLKKNSRADGTSTTPTGVTDPKTGKFTPNRIAALQCRMGQEAHLHIPFLLKELTADADVHMILESSPYLCKKYGIESVAEVESAPGQDYALRNRNGWVPQERKNLWLRTLGNFSKPGTNTNIPQNP